MAEMIVAGFKDDAHRAYDILNLLQVVDEDWAVDLTDAVAVYRDDEGVLRVDRGLAIFPGKAVAWNGLFGAEVDLGISPRFVASAAALIRRGDSAIIALVRSFNPDHVAAALESYSAALLRWRLTAEQELRLDATLRAL